MREEQTSYQIQEEKGSMISADTFRRIYLLNIIDGFRLGSYGLKRLHKIAYIPERDPQEMRSFEFKRYIHGQYSETLDMIKDQLISMGYVTALPLDTAKTIHFKLPDDKTIDLTMGGNVYKVTERTLMDFYRDVLARISPTLRNKIQQAIRDYGYLSEDELLARCYDFPEFVRTQFDDMIFESNLPDQIETPNLSQEECEELELSLNPKFISAMTKIIEGMESSDIDTGRIVTIEKPL